MEEIKKALLEVGIFGALTSIIFFTVNSMIGPKLRWVSVIATSLFMLAYFFMFVLKFPGKRNRKKIDLESEAAQR